ncbi:MAG: hypothetical protein O2835_03385 [Proteobacteria bacterium]|nr:hypothetical protein [Pseudomonadota bacterium]MDA1151610.1 hypothetical protein [Pseudomonadota bacterium]
MTRKFICLFLFGFEILIILLVAVSTAGAQSSHQTFAVVAPPNCQNNEGEIVRFENRSSQTAKSAAGMAKNDGNGQPVIYRFSYERSPAALQNFIDLHECAHHQTGDIDLPHPPRNSPAHMMNESIADCIATLRIRDETEDGASRINDAAGALTAAMEIVGLPKLTIDSRISNINNCRLKDLSAADFIDGVLVHRGLK